MSTYERMTPNEARHHLIKRLPGKIEVRGLIDLRETKIQELSASVRCHDLDATGSELVSLPDDLQVSSRLVLDDCQQLERLPQKLNCGSLSLRNCGYLPALPEGLSTWFLDMTNCRRFSQWPK